RQLLKRFDQLLVALAIFTREARQPRTEVALRLRLRSTEQPAGQHAIGGDANAKFRKHRQDRALRAAADQRVLDLQIADRVNGMRAAGRVRSHFGETDRADVARLHAISKPADSPFDWHPGVAGP